MRENLLQTKQDPVRLFERAASVPLTSSNYVCCKSFNFQAIMFVANPSTFKQSCLVQTLHISSNHGCYKSFNFQAMFVTNSSTFNNYCDCYKSFNSQAIVFVTNPLNFQAIMFATKPLTFKQSFYKSFNFQTTMFVTKSYSKSGVARFGNYSNTSSYKIYLFASQFSTFTGKSRADLNFSKPIIYLITIII